MNLDKEILIVIPFLASGAQGNELELAVTGWRLFFRTPYHIVVVGDHHPIVESGDDISFLPCPRIAPVDGQYLPHLDMVHKFRKVREAFPDSEGFVYTCDDIYPVAESKIGDIIKPKEPVRGFSFTPAPWHGKTPDWYSDKNKTGELCARMEIPVRNWVCHLPVYYDWELLLEIYDRFSCDRVSWIVENIYFNMMYPDDPHALPERDFHDEVTTSYPDIRPLGTVRWVSNANCGWSRRLEGMLRAYYDKIKAQP